MEAGESSQPRWGCFGAWQPPDLQSHLLWASRGACTWGTPAGASIGPSCAPLGFWRPAPVGPHMAQGQKPQPPSLRLGPPSFASGLLSPVGDVIPTLQEADGGQSGARRQDMGAARAGLSHGPLRWVLKEAEGGFPHFLCFFFLPFLRSAPSQPLTCLVFLAHLFPLASLSTRGLQTVLPTQRRAQGSFASQPGGEVSELAHAGWRVALWEWHPCVTVSVSALCSAPRVPRGSARGASRPGITPNSNA